jgi:hypothetical protein
VFINCVIALCNRVGLLVLGLIIGCYLSGCASSSRDKLEWRLEREFHAGHSWIAERFDVPAPSRFININIVVPEVDIGELDLGSSYCAVEVVQCGGDSYEDIIEILQEPMSSDVLQIDSYRDGILIRSRRLTSIDTRGGCVSLSVVMEFAGRGGILVRPANFSVELSSAAQQDRIGAGPRDWPPLRQIPEVR